MPGKVQSSQVALVIEFDRLGTIDVAVTTETHAYTAGRDVLTTGSGVVVDFWTKSSSKVDMVEVLLLACHGRNTKFWCCCKMFD